VLKDEEEAAEEAKPGACKPLKPCSTRALLAIGPAHCVRRLVSGEGVLACKGEEKVEGGG